MGKKKRGGHSRSKNLPTRSPAADKAVQEEKTKAMASEEHIASEFRRAQIAFDRGNFGRAQMITKELSSLYPNAVKAQYCYALFIWKEAKSIKDPSAKRRHLKKAVEPAQRAISLAPDILYCFYLYAWLLFDLASNADEYSEVMQKCQRTLQRLDERGRSKGVLQNVLETLVSSSRHIIQQLEQKNVDFDAEELKQRIRANSEAKLREVQTQYESSEETSEEDWVTEETLQSMDIKEEEEKSLGARRLERRKALKTIKKITSLEGKIAQVRQYWNPLSADTKRGFLRVRISDLKEHLRSVKNDLALPVLSEAIQFLLEKDSWKFMECCVCDEKFTDLLLYVEHFANQHTGGLSERLRSVLPQEIGTDWVGSIEKGEWKPEDARAVLQIGSHVECTLMDMDVYLNSCVKDSSESYSVEEMKKQFDEVLMEAEIGNQNDEKIGKHEPEGSELPLSDYTRRAKTLEKIQAMLQMLLKGRHLSRMHVVQVIQYTLEELQIFASELQLRNLGLDKTLRGICLLEFPQLVKVLRFLHSIAYICGITKFPEKDEALAGAQKSEIKETIRFSVDSSYLHLDERLVTGELDVSTSNNSISNEGSEWALPEDDYTDDTLPGNGLFVPWLLVGRSIEENLASWARLIEDREHKKIEVFDFLKKEFSLLESLCNMKIMHSVNEESLRNIKIMHSFNEEELKKIRSTCDDESNRKAQDPAYVPQYHKYLSKRKEEAEVVDADNTTVVRSQLDLLSNLHEEAHNMREAIRKYEVQTTLELCRTDARITRILAAMQQEGFKIGQASARAYRSILMISLRSFIRAHLEDLVDKDATEKASAAEEALLADLALEAKKSVDRGDSTKKQTEKKSKKKYYRKSEDLKASSCGEQFPEGGKDVEQQELRCQVELEAEEISLETTLESQLKIDDESGKQHLAEQNKLGEKIEQQSSDETAIGTISPGGLQKPESSSTAEQNTILIGKIPLVFEAEQQELRCRVELEAEERSLETTLESQLRIDDESEKQHLAEQNKLGEKIEQQSSDETAIGTISPGGLQMPESSSAAEQNTILIGKTPLVFEAEQQELRCRVELEAEERSLETTLESELRIDDESEKHHLAKQNKLGEKIEQQSSDETAIGTISPGGLQKPESSSSAEQNTILIGEIPLGFEEGKQELRCGVELEVEERSLETTLESQLRIDDESEKQHLVEQNKLGEKIEQQSSNETAIGTISPGGLQKPESSSAAEQNTILIGKIPLVFEAEQQELRCRVELEAEERSLETTLESQLRIDDESEKQHLAEQNKLGEKIEQQSSDETAIGTISPGGLQKPESSSSAEQNTILIGEIPLGFEEEKQELRCGVELEAEERSLETTLESQLRIDDESEKQHLAEQNKLGEKIEQQSSDETAIGTISPGGLQKPESSSAAEQNTILIGKIPLVFEAEQQELRCRVELEAEERSLETTLESQLRIDDESEKQHLAEKNKLGEKIEQQSSDETAIATISPGGLQNPESSSAAEQNTILIGKIPLVFEAEQQELRCRVELEAEERSLETILESQLRIDDESEKQHLAEQNKLGEKIEQQSSDETAIGTISPGGLQKPESLLSAEQNTILIGKIPLVLEKGKSVVFSKGSDDDPSVSEQLAYHKSTPLPSSDSSSDKANNGDPDNEDSKNPDQDDDNGTHQDFPESSERVPQRISPKREEFKALQTDACGAGLKNEDNNCSLNAIIQSLWNLRRFRCELMKSAAHVHVQEDCVYCSLHLIFCQLNLASMCTPRKAISPTPLRNALGNFDPESNLYKKGEMNDASEILNKILEGLHQPFGKKQEESNIRDHLDCASNDCLAHSLFGIKIRERVACYHCGCESRQYSYNSPFHLINASELRKKKITHKDSSFDKLLKLVKMDDQVTCNPEEGGCGKLNSNDQILSIPPSVFVVLLGWQSVRENLEDISTALAALTTEIDIAVIYGGLDEGRKHHLISMVCFHSQHLTCFAYDPEHKNWVHYNDEIVEVIGQWNDVVTKCKQGNFQPQLLFYEAPLDE